MFAEKIVGMIEPGFVCRTCGQSHDGVPLSFAADFPDMYANMSESDRGARALISSDQCIVDEELFFIRGCLEIPLLDSSPLFILEEEHHLATAQRHGISRFEAMELSATLLHMQGPWSRTPQ
jgi:hypothetical protein